MLIQTVALSETTARIAAAAWRELDPRLLMVYFEGTDGIGHLFAPYVSPPVAGAPAAMVERFGDTPAAYYAWLDGHLGDLFALLGPEDTLILCSDHGFEWGDGRPQTTASGTLDRNAPSWHRLEGMVAVAGAGARSAARGEGSVFDIAPTLLEIFGLPQGDAMTGTPLTWALAGAPAAQPRVAYGRLVTLEAAAPDRPATAEELEQLRALGYIGAAPTTSTTPTTSATSPAEDLTGGALNNLGARRLDSGDLDGAEEAFRRAIAAEPGYPGAYRNLANVLLRRGRVAQAVGVFEQAFARGIADADRAAVELALALVERGERARAVDLLAPLAAKRPQSYALHVNLGTLLADGGRFADALAAYRRACELEPGNALAWRNRGLAALQLGRRDEAAMAFSHSLAIQPDQPELRRLLAPPGRANG
jgi:tetratricopeptide (TPR) repeat protein